jgi:glycosyltransferase involved in cell wall biosynthesis
MRIAQIAPLQVTVPPRDYGGTERVIAALIDALVDLGHSVSLFASGDSYTKARLEPALPHALNFDPAYDATAAHVALLTQVYRRASEFDVIHSHLDYLTLPFTSGTTTPTVLTLHSRLDNLVHQRVLTMYPDANYIAISHDQRRSLPTLHWVDTIYHGIDVEGFRFCPRPGNYLAFVGRISPEKRPDRAIAIARQAGIPLKIAAKVDSAELPYFETAIKPLLDDPQVEFLGAIDEASKRELIGGALALLLPIDWPEPFGLIFIEALACGTPVLTCPRGSVPEILVNGVTGYSCLSDEELVAAVSRVGQISRAGCRDYVRQRFDSRRMAQQYLLAYERVRGGLHPTFRSPSHAAISETVRSV